ncbi:ribonuclease R [Deinococcus sp. A31D244]|uniref:ribonuclease R n=1 Tax=Deinococcus sp. A31D244 TaxID=3397675 RepID=UPI0039DF540F
MPKTKKTETAVSPRSAAAGATQKVQRKQKQRPDVTATQPEADATIPTTSQPDAPAATGASRAARKPAGAGRRGSSGAQPRPEASALAETPRKTARKATPTTTITSSEVATPAADPVQTGTAVASPRQKKTTRTAKTEKAASTARRTRTAAQPATQAVAQADPAPAPAAPAKRGRGKRALTIDGAADVQPTEVLTSTDSSAVEVPASQQVSASQQVNADTAKAKSGRGRRAADRSATVNEVSPAGDTASETAGQTVKPRRGRKPHAETAAPVMPEAAAPEAPAAELTAADAPVAQVPVPEVAAGSADDQPVVDAPAPRRGRGRPAGTKQSPASVVATGIATESGADLSAEIGAAQEPVRPARRGRKPHAETLPGAESPAEPQVVSPTGLEAADLDSATDPVILEVPKKRGGRGRRAALPEHQTLPDVLSGVEAIGEQAVPAAGTVQADAPAKPARRGRKPRVQADAQELTDAPAETPAAAGVQSSGETSPADAPHETPDDQFSLAEGAGSDEADSEVPSDEADDGTGMLEANPARDIVVAQLRKLGRPVHVKDLERTFTRQTIRRLGNWRDLTDLLESLVEQGQVIRTRKKTYGLPEAMSLVRGRFQASAAGFGFVIPDSGGDDFYIPAEQTMEAWNGDIVLVRMEGRGDTGRSGGPRRGQKGDGNPRASVVRIVQRAYKQLVGTLEFHHGHPILKPDDHRARHRILVLPDGLDELEAGARVVTELFWPENTGEDEVFGQVTRVLGAEDDPVTETEAVIVKFGLRGEFPPEVEEQANAIPKQIPEEALRGRLDLREFNIFTVDGRDAKDFDDAIHIQPTPEGTFVVGIHIADVSHYVTEGTPLDDEAYARATSVYLPGRVLPMLPEHLSNGVCSLVPYEDRLTMTAMVELSAEGEILKVQIAPSVINSKARLTYDEVQAYSEATATLPEQARQLEGDLHLLLKITTKLRQKRLREGSLDFKLREVKVDVGADGRMELIPIREETARGMIEDLMLLANKVVAHELLQREIPALFRIHEEPTLQRFQDVTNAIGRLGFSFPGGEPTPQAYQAVLKQVRGTPRESVVNTLLLRSMQQAKYAGENLGHFGLAFEEYLHFTSPIRRYPDLLVHRVLKGMLSGELKAGNREVAKLQGRLPAMGDHTSDRERTASEAERDLTKYYQAKWAQEHLGESFTGNVSGVVASGLFVALDNGVEGKLHISNLDDDYYAFIEDAQMLRGRSRGRSYRLGDPVHVTIGTVNPLARQTDFTLADPTSPDYRPGDIHQETDMDSPVKPRARRREDREQEKREKLQTVAVSEPKKFTLEDPSQQAAAPAQEERAPRGGRGPREGGRDGREGSREGRGRTFGGVSMSAGRGSRRVITLERPRNEHLRPVNITVQRMYFGDWTLENMPPEDSQGGRGGRPAGRGDRAAERGADRGGRSFTRGGSDRGAVQRVNGRQSPQGGRGAQNTQRESVTAQVPDTAAGAATSADDAKRRRRRRGRRGNGSSGPQG